MPYRMGTDTSGTQAAWIGPSREIQTSTSVRLGVERVELVLPLWRCRSFDPSLQSDILDAGTLCVASDGRVHASSWEGAVKLICALLDAPAARRHDGRGRRRLRRHRCHLRRRGGHETHKLLARGRRGSRAGRDGHRRRPPRDDWRGRGRVAPADGVEVHLISLPWHNF